MDGAKRYVVEKKDNDIKICTEEKVYFKHQ